MAEPKERETVPMTPPFGGPTDADHYCGRCGDQLTGCALCAGEYRAVLKRGRYA